MKKAILLAVTLLVFSGSAAAGGSLRAALASGTYEEDYDVGSDYEAELFGGEFRAAFELNEHLFLRGQYLHTEADEVEVDGDDVDVDLDVDVLRLGAGYGGKVGRVRMYGVLEFVDFGFEVDDEDVGDNGFGGTFGVSDLGENKFLWSAEVSLLKVDDSTGASIDATFGFRFTPAFAGLVGVQSYVFDDDDVESSLTHVMLGGQFRF